MRGTMDNSLYKLYSSPQHGAGMATFSGSKRHLIGGGILGTIARFAIPLLKSVGRTLMSGATRGATDYLAGNQDFLPAMVSGVGNEVANRWLQLNERLLVDNRLRKNGKYLVFR